MKNTKYIKDYRELINIFHIFHGKNYIKYEGMNFDLLSETPQDTKKIHTLMENEGFVFA